MSGPQEERLSKWSKEADLGYPEQRETIRGPQLAGKEKRHQDSLNQYRAQVEHLKQLVQRQEVVINNYQIKYPTVTPPSDTTVDEALDAELPPWVADPQHLSPLLSAYDERMRELEDENTKLKDQALSFKGRADELVKENERVRKDLQHYIEKMLKHAEGPEGGIDVGNAMGGGQGADSEALTDLTEMADVLNKTNSIMTEQIAMLETELGKTKASEQTASERLEKVSKTASEQALSLTQLSQLNKTLENERDDTARRMKDIVAELSNAHTAKERLEVEKKHANDGLRKKETEARDLKDALSDIGRAANTERESLEDRMNSVIEDANHLRQQLRSTEAELDAAREQLRRISLEFETTRADAEGMLKVMNGMEEQLTEYASREEQTVTLVKESKERVETALLERDQAVAREVQSRQEIARLLEKRREYAKELMAAEEKVAKETRDRMMEQLKARDEELNQLSERCAILQTDMARKDREAKAAQAERMSLLGEVNEERQRLRDSIDAFAAKSLERTTRQNEAEEKAAAAQAMLAEKEQAMALSLADVQDRLDHAKQRGDDLSTKLSARAAEAARLTKMLEARDLSLEKVREELDHLRTRDNEEKSALAAVHSRQVADLQTQLERTQMAHKDAQEKTSALVTAQERMAERARRNLEDAVATAQRQLRDKTDEADRAESRARELEGRYAALITEQHDMEDNYLKMAADLEDAKNAKRLAEAKSTAAAGQLANLLKKEEEKLKELSESKMENERLRRQITRGAMH